MIGSKTGGTSIEAPGVTGRPCRVGCTANPHRACPTKESPKVEVHSEAFHMISLTSPNSHLPHRPIFPTSPSHGRPCTDASRTSSNRAHVTALSRPPDVAGHRGRGPHGDHQDTCGHHRRCAPLPASAENGREGGLAAWQPVFLKGSRVCQGGG